MTRVSVIVPCYNEEKTVKLLLEAVLAQTYPSLEMEVVLADGMSGDKTRNHITEFQLEHPELMVSVVDNVKRNIPAGLNRAIEAAQGEFLVRLDGHSVPAPDYVERCIAALEEGKGTNVGGVWQIRPGGSGWMARSIATAASHPLGVGDALYRYTTDASYVDTVPFGSFRKELIVRLGLYDETLLTNEDYELNTRIRLDGGKIWLDPMIRSVYFARSNLIALAKQYFRYGFWKLRMLRRYPHTIKARQALPPLFVLSLMILCVCSLFWPVARILLLGEVMVYLVALLAGAASTAVRLHDPLQLIGIPLSIATMHLSWGTGFLVSLIKR